MFIFHRAVWRDRDLFRIGGYGHRDVVVNSDFSLSHTYAIQPRGIFTFRFWYKDCRRLSLPPDTQLVQVATRRKPNYLNIVSEEGRFVVLITLHYLQRKRIVSIEKWY